jgi:hypothetical protein
VTGTTGLDHVDAYQPDLSDLLPDNASRDAALSLRPDGLTSAGSASLLITRRPYFRRQDIRFCRAIDMSD